MDKGLEKKCSAPNPMDFRQHVQNKPDFKLREAQLKKIFLHRRRCMI